MINRKKVVASFQEGEEKKEIVASYDVKQDVMVCVFCSKPMLTCLDACLQVMDPITQYKIHLNKLAKDGLFKRTWGSTKLFLVVWDDDSVVAQDG